MTGASIPDRLEVLDEIAHGEGEILLRARDKRLRREVVLRRPAPGLAHTWTDAKRGEPEIRSARKSVTSAELEAAITNALRDQPTQNPNLEHREKSGGDGQFVFFTHQP